ncbi:uncharacterized protein LOC124150699 [Haliotis rufescens]|uniref:uncharacterized protein LOC124150699 n=1 Tax=Haliotis rufescens TaxID=6454 RepID=UPI00201E9E6E|nr:uncharacterized protein LOC124150699 [Haliotis rufescens]
MMRLTRTLLLAVSYAFMQGISVNEAENIMLAKPSEVSETYWNAEFANDGLNNPGSTPARTWSGVNPFWKGDLQGHYAIHNISVTSDVSYTFGGYLGGAYVEVHADGSSGCPDLDIFVCGQCPEVVGKGETFTFNCSHPRPVRFVKVWRNMTDFLVISEVEVEGTPVTARVANYNKVFNTKVSTPMTSLTVVSASECSSKCYTNQSCLSYSHHPTAAPNCLLTTNPEDAASASGWTKFSIDVCSSYNTCG